MSTTPPKKATMRFRSCGWPSRISHEYAPFQKCRASYDFAVPARIFLLGIPIDSVTRGEALARIRSLLLQTGQHHVMTPNSEMLVLASKNDAFRATLKRSALNLPDSAGLLFAARWTHQKLPERVTGVDTVIALLQEISCEHPVFLLGGGEGIAQAVASEFQRRNISLRIVGAYAGSPHEKDAAPIVDRINEVRPHLLLVAYGAPEQDLWIAKHLSSMPTVRVAMGVGGTFDFLSGNVRRAPVFLQSLGLEWLWRFVQEPRRRRRIMNAVIVFPWLIIRGASPFAPRTTASRPS